MVVTSSGIAAVFVPLSLVALHRVREEDSGVASSLLNTGQQVGGAIGLAALGTVVWTAATDSLRAQAAEAVKSGHPINLGHLPASVYGQALTAGITRGFLVATGIALAVVVTSLLTIRVQREGLPAASAAAQAQPTNIKAAEAARL
jgi:hypothetical protein